MRKILIGYDGSSHGDDALALGRMFAAAAGDDADVAVVTVHKALPPKSSHGELSLQEERLRHEAEQTLSRARSAWPQLAESCFRTVRASSPSAGLQRLAADGGFDVIVVGDSHRRGLGRVWPGSATEQTLQGSPRAVAIAPPGYAADASALRRIGIGYDGSAEGRHALDLVADLAAGAGATVLVISVVDTVMPPLMDAYGVGSLVDELRERAVRLLEDARDVLGERGVGEVETARPEGGPVTELVAASANVDLLVLGSRNHGPAMRLLLGAVSARVVRDAACPVLIHPRSARAETDVAAGADAAASRV